LKDKRFGNPKRKNDWNALEGRDVKGKRKF